MTSERNLEPYLSLIRNFTDEHKTASEFMHEYLDRFTYDEDKQMSNDAYDILNNLFFACDVYCDDPELRGEHDIGEKQFFKEAAYARREFEELLNDSEDPESTE